MNKKQFISLIVSAVLLVCSPFGGVGWFSLSADSSFEAQIANFPESYKPYLREMHAAYPNWVFYADKLSVSFNEAVDIQYNTPFRKVVNMKSDGVSWRSMNSGNYNWGDGAWRTIESGRWTGASREVIAYYMDPRNFLEQNTVFMFLQQSYDPRVQTSEGLKKIVSGTFLARGYDGGSYIDDIMAAAGQSGVNPYVIAATIIIEQGNEGTSSLISGTYPGYEGYYNFFNFGATGNSVVASGLSYAKTSGWTSRRLSIIGGAVKYAKEYIARGQDTYYYKDFNVRNGNYSHQYAQSVYDARASAVALARKLDKTAPMSFYIPVYSNIPNSRAVRPDETEKRNNYYLSSLAVTGLSPAFDMYKYSYSISVSGDTAVMAQAVNGAKIISATRVPTSAGRNMVPITVQAENGFTNTYNLTVNAAVPCTLIFNAEVPPALVYKNGDTNGDGSLNVVDLANIKKAIVGRIVLGSVECAAADTNGDGKINVVDLANVKKAIVGRITL